MQTTGYLLNYYLGILIKMKCEEEFIKTRLKDSAFTSFWSYNYNSEINSTKNERLALNNLSNIKNIIIQKSDKGNSVVLLHEDKHIAGMCKRSNNNANFQMLRLITTTCTFEALAVAYYMV